MFILSKPLHSDTYMKSMIKKKFFCKYLDEEKKSLVHAFDIKYTITTHDYLLHILQKSMSAKLTLQCTYETFKWFLFKILTQFFNQTQDYVNWKFYTTEKKFIY